jgi:hypothetical protein
MVSLSGFSLIASLTRRGPSTEACRQPNLAMTAAADSSAMVGYLGRSNIAIAWSSWSRRCSGEGSS